MATTSAAGLATPEEFTHFTACDVCRKRKKRCDGRIAGCQHCAAKGIACIYTPKRSRSAAAPRRTEVLTNRTEDLDERLRRIEDAVYRNLRLRDESLLRRRPVREGSSSTSGDSDGEKPKELWDPRILKPAVPSQSPVDSAASTTPRAITTPFLPSPPSPPSPSHSPRFEGSVSLFCLPLEDTAGLPCLPPTSTVFIGASSPFSFISHRGIRWIDAKLGTSSFSALIRRGKVAYLSYDDGAEITGRGVCGLPIPGGMVGGANGFVETPELRALYIDEYLTRVNPITPLFSRHFFSNPTPTHLRCPRTLSASTSIALALGAQHLSRTSPPDSTHHRAATYYFTLTSRSLPSFLFSTTLSCIPAVQALVGMALYLQESDDSQPIFTLLGLATSIATQVGLHRDPRKLQIVDEAEREERLGVWWVLFCLDKEQALRTGRMSGIAERDVDVPLPPAGTPFSRRVGLAWTMSRVLRLLYATTPAPPSVVTLLQKELESWLACSDEVRSPLTTVLAARPRSWEEMADVMRTRWNYFCCLISVYQLPSSETAGKGLECWARKEAEGVIAVLAGGALPTRGAMLILAAAGWVVFFARVCKGQEEGEPEGGEEGVDGEVGVGVVEMLKGIEECLRGTLWRPGEGARMKVLLLELVAGMVELAKGL